jgi:hypothetical protein
MGTENRLGLSPAFRIAWILSFLVPALPMVFDVLGMKFGFEGNYFHSFLIPALECGMLLAASVALFSKVPAYGRIALSIVSALAVPFIDFPIMCMLALGFYGFPQPGEY